MILDILPYFFLILPLYGLLKKGRLKLLPSFKNVKIMRGFNYQAQNYEIIEKMKFKS